MLSSKHLCLQNLLQKIIYALVLFIVYQYYIILTYMARFLSYKVCSRKFLLNFRVLFECFCSSYKRHSMRHTSTGCSFGASNPAKQRIKLFCWLAINMTLQLYLKRCDGFVNLKRYQDILWHIFHRPTMYKRDRAVDHQLKIKLRSKLKEW